MHTPVGSYRIMVGKDGGDAVGTLAATLQQKGMWPEGEEVSSTFSPAAYNKFVEAVRLLRQSGRVAGPIDPPGVFSFNTLQALADAPVETFTQPAVRAAVVRPLPETLPQVAEPKIAAAAPVVPVTVRALKPVEVAPPRIVSEPINPTYPVRKDVALSHAPLLEIAKEPRLQPAKQAPVALSPVNLASLKIDALPATPSSVSPSAAANNKPAAPVIALSDVPLVSVTENAPLTKAPVAVPQVLASLPPVTLSPEIKSAPVQLAAKGPLEQAVHAVDKIRDRIVRDATAKGVRELPVWPLLDTSEIVRDFGGKMEHPILGIFRAHVGDDTVYADRRPKGPVVSAITGTVTEANNNPGQSRGRHVEITGEHYKIKYFHASRLFVKEGDTVNQGELVMNIGKSGVYTSGPMKGRKSATGEHLHYELWERVPFTDAWVPLDPSDFHEKLRGANGKVLHGKKGEFVAADLHAPVHGVNQASLKTAPRGLQIAVVSAEEMRQHSGLPEAPIPYEMLAGKPASATQMAYAPDASVGQGNLPASQATPAVTAGGPVKAGR